ncbi:hypothetical protein JNUCC1_00328 [Lentibacillus sp. JNUCC-1]|uniref:hypothetical protein n=1 Tax=Lentibacillus sp. JNUCC-1 TaxID=2654513 RepID=UPI0012E847B9|nr:hypothetical protein [Lentibacillus sp. JNUCC-1]MUV36525.1 hypothetical protein [Lentibacillus sp. JNUCC-1]
MFYYVENCFHWIGFHLVQHLLDAGECVIGIDQVSSPQKEHLYLFMGRHDRFQLMSREAAPANGIKKDVNLQVCNNKNGSETDNGHIHIVYGTEHDQTNETIDLPLLFGFWMPMTEFGMKRVNGEWLPFASDAFLNEAVYIEDYMNDLVHCIREGCLSEISSSCPNQYLANLGKVKDNRTIKTNLSIVQEHYHRNTSFYPETNAY